RRSTTELRRHVGRMTTRPPNDLGADAITKPRLILPRATLRATPTNRFRRAVRQLRMGEAGRSQVLPGWGGGLGGHAATTVTSVYHKMTCVFSSCPPRWRSRRHTGGQPPTGPVFERP